MKNMSKRKGMRVVRRVLLAGVLTISIGGMVRADGPTSTLSGGLYWGEDTRAGGWYATAFGSNTNADGWYSTAFGDHTLANGWNSTAFGSQTKATGWYTTAFGDHTLASGWNGTAFGSETKATGWYTTAFGDHTLASGWNATAFGSQTKATGWYTTAFGNRTLASGDYATAFGLSTKATGRGATSFGNMTEASGDNATAFGLRTKATGRGATSFGDMTEASGDNATAFGLRTKATGRGATSFGNVTVASGDYATAFGTNTVASGKEATAFGISTEASGDYATAFGWGSVASGDNSLAALGGVASANNSMAIGARARAELSGSVAMGAGAVANREHGASGYLADGNTTPTWVATSNALAIGAENKDGTEDARVTRQIIGVAAGTRGTDAVNVAQLQKATEGIAGSVNDLYGQIGGVGAGAAALAGLHPLDYDPDYKWDFTAAYGHYAHSEALAMGLFYRPNSQYMVSAGAVIDRYGDMYNIGVSAKIGRGNDEHVGTSRTALIHEVRHLKADNEELREQMDLLMKKVNVLEEALAEK